MTNAEPIAKIKAEIERLMECVGKASRELKDFTPYMDGELSAYEDILDFLSDLEESKESVPKDLEEAAKEYAKDAYPDKHNLVWMFKRGAKWQAEHTPLPEDTVLFNKGVEEGKRLMMEEAVSVIESRLSEILGDAQPKPILRTELEELINRIKDGK